MTSTAVRRRREWPWLGVAAGLGLIAAWFAATRTTLLLAYGTPATGIHTLAQAQGLCDSSIGQYARTLSAQGAANCSGVDAVSMHWNIAGFAGLLLAISCGVLLAYRATQGNRA